MIRNLKVLLAAAMALAAFGALSATAHAAEEVFHCSVEKNCTATLSPDEAAGTVTAHHVFVLKGKNALGEPTSVSFTCNQLSGEASSEAKTTSELTFTNLKYLNSAGEKKCKVGASETVEVNFTSCDYKFTSTNGSKSTAEVHVLCPTAGDGIDILVSGELCVKITPLTGTGLGYTTRGAAPSRFVTATANVSLPISAVMLENKTGAKCAGAGIGGIATLESATYTTGNTLVKGEKGGVAAEAWFE
jgi:hypothetical protein